MATLDRHLPPVTAPRATKPARPTTSALAIALFSLLLSATNLVAQSTEGTAPKYDPEVVKLALERARGYEPVRYPESAPPDGEWFTSEAGDFYVSRINKEMTRGLFRITAENKVRMTYGLELPLVEETDEDLFIIRPKPVIRRQTARKPEPAVVADAAPKDAPRGDESLVEPQRLQVVTSPFDKGLPTASRWRNNVIAADVNADGHVDLIHGPPRKATPRPHFFLGDGAGNWTNADIRFRGGRLDYGDIAVADFDADGQLDMALAMHLIGTTVGYGSGQFSFQERSEGFDRPDWAQPDSQFGKRAPWSSRAIAATDIDQDGDLDLLAIGEGAESMSLMRTEDSGERVQSPGLTLYMNSGESPDGASNNRAHAWSAVRFTDLPAGGDRVALGNFDSDPQPEAVVAWAQANATNLLLDFDFSDSELPSVIATIPEALDRKTRTTITAVAAGDVLPGAADEIVIGRLVFHNDTGWQGRVELLSRKDGNIDGEWVAHTLAVWQSAERVNDLEVGDLDGDGHLDIVASTSASRIHLMRNSGNGTFYLSNESIVAEQYNCNAFSLAVADLNGDGKAEIASGFSGEQLNIPGIQTIPSCTNNGRISAWQVASMDPGPSSSGAGAIIPIVVHEYQTAPLSTQERALQRLKDSEPPK